MQNKPKFAVGDKVSVYPERDNYIITKILNGKNGIYYKVVTLYSDKSPGNTMFYTEVLEEFLDHAET